MLKVMGITTGAIKKENVMNFIESKCNERNINFDSEYWSATVEKIVSLMKENSSIKVNEISRQVGLGMTTITKRIRQLKEKGLIERKGSKKKGYWIVNIK